MNLVGLGLIGALFSFVASAATLEEIKNRGEVKSRTIAGLLPAVDKLHEDAEVEYSPAGGRETRVYRVTREGSETEECAIFQLVDAVNTFDSAIEGEEQVSVKLIARPSYEDVALAFVSDYPEDWTKELKAKITTMRGRLGGIVATNPKVVFYRIFSSNEAQGHLGFVLYNRRTREALYVSTVSDH